MALATAAAVAGTTVLSQYLDAKFHIRKDLEAISKMSTATNGLKQAVKRDRLSLWYLFRNVASEYPDATCIWSRNGIYTWQDIHDQACRYAQFLISLGVQPGSLVGVYLMNCPEFLFIWMALWSLGCAPALINYNLTGDALAHCLKLAGAKVILVDGDESCQARIRDSKDKVEVELGLKVAILTKDKKAEINALEPTPAPRRFRIGVKRDFPMCLLYTSGTTGMPKGCSFPTDRVWMMSKSAGTTLGQKRGPGGDRWYDCMPMYHGTGGISAVTCLIGGVSIAIGKKFSVSNFWKDIHDSESTFFIYVGETARYLLAAPPGPYDKDHKVRCMYGNGLRPDVWERFRERFNVPEIAEFFNSTEGMFSLLNWDRGPYFANCVGHHGLLLRMMYKDAYVPVAVDHETGDIWRDPITGFAKRNKYTEGGELIVKLANEKVFQGYWNSPSATEKKFARNVFKKGDVYYRTGDGLRRTDDGRWFFMDRLGDTFRWKSENVATAEVAQVLGQFPGVVDANVYGVVVPNHEGRAGCVALYVDPQLKGSFDYNGLLKHAKKHLPKYAVPAFIRVVKESSIIHNNKQNKVGLRAEGVDPDLTGSKEISGKGDTFLWAPSKDEDKYVEFGRKEWESLTSGQFRL